jgi:hypothetical protein
MAAAAFWRIETRSVARGVFVRPSLHALKFAAAVLLSAREARRDALFPR